MDIANNIAAKPVLYSFRRCPYAIRARMALAYAGITVEHREVVLRNKPEAMLAISPKGSVPVLQLPDGHVIDESVDIIHWALDQHDPENWRSQPVSGSLDEWVGINDGPFKAQLDRYKYADRYPERTAADYREAACDHLKAIDNALSDDFWLHGQHAGVTDIALFPFIRQFAMVDYDWFETAPFPNLRRWLEKWLEDPRFLRVMKKHAAWAPGQPPIYSDW
jgi:glutathione S-transferase